MSAKVYIETFGCQMNVADTERAATRLRAAGYQLIESEENADAVIFNTCSVRSRAEQKVYTRVGEVRNGGRRRGNSQKVSAANKRTAKVIGVMGCVAQLEGKAVFDQAPAVNLVVGTRATDRLPELLDRALAKPDSTFIDLGERASGEEWDVATSERRSPHTAFVPIIEGCNKFCSFCIVPYSRGRERSRPSGEIIAEIEKLRDQNYREVHLIGQNVNSYSPRNDAALEKYEGATAFSKLLRAVAQTDLPRIKFTTSFPRDFHPDIVRAMEEHENLCDWVHLPIQSGNDRILKLMRRGHKSADYLERVATIKNATRRLALTSDIIVGFPGETQEEFGDTLKLVQSCQYDGLYIFKYSMRKGTPAAKLPDEVDDAEITERFLRLEDEQMEIQKRIYESYIGQEVQVLVEGVSAKSLQEMTGHTSCNKVINFAADESLLGQIVRVKVTEAKNHSLRGVVI